MQELIAINIPIGDRTYRIRISPSDEEQVRKIIRMINDKIIEFKTQFAGKDMQDYIAMVIMWYATQQQNGQSSVLEKDLGDLLGRMEGNIDKALVS
jgi:cell division protein ZapA (FtsZ GTPase activity inhibitor)